jgi:serpin B
MGIFPILSEIQTAEKPADAIPYVRENIAFATSLHKSLAADHPGNIVSSPPGVQTLLLAALQGADGSTATAIRNAVGNASASDPAAALSTSVTVLQESRKIYQSAAAAWFDSSPPPIPWNRDVLSSLNDSGFDVFQLPMRADSRGSSERINRFIRKNTRNTIREILKPGDMSNSGIVLTAAAHLEGRWATAFNKSGTRDETFQLEPHGKAQVPMMRVRDASFRSSVTDTFEAIELPYKGGGLSMLVVVPRRGTLAVAESKFTAPELALLRSRLVEGKFSEVAMPRFEFHRDFDLKKSLSSMGLGSLFSRRKADFQNFLSSGVDHSDYPLWIEKFIQKNTIRVDEKGTKATSATATYMMAYSAPSRSFRVDRPFLFVVQDTATGYVLFIGRVTNPLELS